ETVDELEREVGIAMFVDAAHDFLRVPRGADLTARVTRVEEPEQLVPAVVVDAFVGLGQQAATPIQRIVCAATMTERLVLHPSATLIELLVRELHDMKRVCDLGGVGEHRVDNAPL